MNEWISVKDKLPEPKEYVLLWLPSVGTGCTAIGCRDTPIGTKNSDYYADSNTDWYARQYRYRDYEVTHWMPLPEPPNGNL